MTLELFIEQLKAVVTEIKEIRFEYSDGKLSGYIAVKWYNHTIKFRINEEDGDVKMYKMNMKYKIDDEQEYNFYYYSLSSLFIDGVIYEINKLNRH